MLTLLAIIVVIVLVAAWVEGGPKPMRWIEQPVTAPGAALSE
jgi:hypothetical protein